MKPVHRAGVQYLLPATWTALHPHGVELPRLAQLLSEQPAKLAGLSNRKGKLAVGYDADIVVRLCAPHSDISQLYYKIYKVASKETASSVFVIIHNTVHWPQCTSTIVWPGYLTSQCCS